SFYAQESVDYILQHNPWGEDDLVDEITITSPSGDAYVTNVRFLKQTLRGPLYHFPFSSNEAGVHTILTNFNDESNDNYRSLGFNLIIDTGNYTKDRNNFLPLFPSRSSILDSDGDLINDDLENLTNYLKIDSDEDSINDMIEQIFGSDPLNNHDLPYKFEVSQFIDESNSWLLEFSVTFFKHFPETIKQINYQLVLPIQMQFQSSSIPQTEIFNSGDLVDNKFSDSRIVSIIEEPLNFAPYWFVTTDVEVENSLLTIPILDAQLNLSVEILPQSTLTIEEDLPGFNSEYPVLNVDPSDISPQLDLPLRYILIPLLLFSIIGIMIYINKRRRST
ncbi:MAG: hypothetical protein ACW99Q_22880, partial [Candidatus Kariarchaeaceae archaeon]